MSCTCKRCEECEGMGSVFQSITGKYIGSHRWDDLDVMIECPICEGDSIIEVCEECRIAHDDEVEMEWLQEIGIFPSQTPQEVAVNEKDLING